MSYALLLGVLGGIGLLLFLILYVKIPAFIALLISSILTGLVCGLDGTQVIDTIQKGMASTLGFVAIVVGLGAMFGAILEHSGGAQAIGEYVNHKLGSDRAPLAMSITGFLVAIPVFFDVAFIILIPVVYALQQKTGKSLLLYAIPLLAGLATTHAFIPPTPGPIAVADIVKADLGWVIAIGFLTGIPTVAVAGLWFGRHIAQRIWVGIPEGMEPATSQDRALPPVRIIGIAIGLPMLLILLATTTKSGLLPLNGVSVSGFGQGIVSVLQVLGHPFIALLLANLYVWFALGIRRGMDKNQLLDITTRSLAPAGTIILLTGAGGVFKQVLVDTGAGEMMATSLSGMGLPIIVFAFLAAALVRIAQGSATVAMITAAGLVSPLLSGDTTFSSGQLACLVIAIASGASILSHVNDSGFWLVKQYLGLTETQTFRSWTMTTVWLALTGFLSACLWYVLL